MACRLCITILPLSNSSNDFYHLIYVSNMENDDLVWRCFTAIARRPKSVGTRMSAFIINGYCFHTQRRDKGRILVLWWKLKEKLIMEKSMTSLSWIIIQSVRLCYSDVIG